ncbi:MAG: hypothetical protein ACRBN8_43835 [Nannocystales bacterium]
MSRPRMWMQVGTWPPPPEARPRAGHVQWQPPPVFAQWRPSRNSQVQRRRWIAASIVSAAAFGATAGSLATAMLIGAVCG